MAFTPRVRCTLLAALALAGCAAGAPAPTRAPTTSAPVADETPCARAANERAQVAALRGAGKLDRALRTLDAADARCPADARASQAPRLQLLIEIGRDAEARALATQLGALAAVTADEQAAIAATRSIDPTQGFRALRGDCAASFAAAMTARARGDAVEAQRGLDRALHACAASAGAGPTVEHVPATVAFGGRLRVDLAGDRAVIGAPRGPIVFPLSPTAAPRPLLGPARLDDLAIAADGSAIALVSAGEVQVLDAGTGALLRALDAEQVGLAPGAVRGVAFQGGASDRLAIFGDGLALYDLRAKRPIARPIATAVAAVAIDAIGATIVAARADGHVVAIDPTSFAVRDTIAEGARLSLSADGSTLATERGVYELTTARIRLARTETGPFALSPNGGRLAAIAGDGAIEVRDGRTGAVQRRIANGARRFVDLAFAGDERALIVLDGAGEILRYALPTLWPSTSDREDFALVALPDRSAGFLLLPSGEVELFGDARPGLACRFGALRMPFEICEERYSAAGTGRK